MPRRRELRGIVNSFVKFLIGRNNDYQGYWAVGHLNSWSEKNRVNPITFELLVDQQILSTNFLSEMSESFNSEFTRILDAHGINKKWIASAILEFQFDAEYIKEFHFWRSALGKPFIVKMVIESDLGQVFHSVNGGNVLPHNPLTEKRSSRY